MNALCPPPLLPGQTIGVMAPASYIDEKDIETGKAALEKRGYRVYIHPQTTARHHQSAGSEAQKIEAFHDLLRDESVHAIMLAAGGNRTLHWIDAIDLDLLIHHPKPLAGFSDATSLLNLIAAKTGLVTYHGPTLRWTGKHGGNHDDLTQMLGLLGGGEQSIPLDGADILRGGAASGPLYGGNASIMQYLLNDLPLSGALLFLEDWNIETSRLDLLFRALHRAGVFTRINGLILGTFDNLQDTGRPFGFTLSDIVAEHTRGYDFPVVMNAPFGHGWRLITLPVGRAATLDGARLTLA